jgi:hypothetical protein
LETRRSRVWVATDGELTRERCPIVYEAMPGAATMLAPRSDATDVPGGA